MMISLKIQLTTHPLQHEFDEARKENVSIENRENRHWYRDDCDFLMIQFLPNFHHFSGFLIFTSAQLIVSTPNKTNMNCNFPKIIFLLYYLRTLLLFLIELARCLLFLIAGMIVNFSWTINLSNVILTFRFANHLICDLCQSKYHYLIH